MSSRDRRATKIVEQFDDVLGGLPDFPEGEVERIRELVRVGEWAIALENLCSQLYEYEFVVSPTILGHIEELGRETGVEPRYWTRLSVGADEVGS